MELIYSKTIDKSLLTEGFSIRVSFLDTLCAITGRLAIGESRDIRLLLNGRIYEGIKFKNSPFSREKYPTHSEMYQVRYSPQSDFSKALRAIYSEAWEYIQERRMLSEIAKKRGEKLPSSPLPKHLQMPVAFYTSTEPDLWIVETYTSIDAQALVQDIQAIDELQYEQTDDTAHIREVTTTVRMRVLDRQIGAQLKRVYDHRCQICGERIGERYGNAEIVDAHHIRPFTQSHNNDSDNIMVLCPNHHRIIHQCHGEFRRRKKEIWYPNGLHEPLLLNLHL